MSGRSGLVVVYDQAVMNVNKTMNKRMQGLYCQEKTHSSKGGVILTVGDGDFSFSLSLASELDLRGTEKSSRLVATSYDPLSQVVAKYPSATVTLNQLARQGVCVLHSVDAMTLPDSVAESLTRATAARRPGFNPPRTPSLLGQCSRIIFNFPHLGGGTQDDVDANRAVLRDFFATLTPLLTPPAVGCTPPVLPLTNTHHVVANKGYTAGEAACADADAQLGGQVHVSLRTSTFYQSWQLVELAQEQGFRLLRTAPFVALHYPGYQEQRTQPGTMRTLPPPAHGALIYIFVRVPKNQEGLRVVAQGAGKPVVKVKRSVRRAIARTAAAAGTTASIGDDDENDDADYVFDDFDYSAATPLKSSSADTSAVAAHEAAVPVALESVASTASSKLKTKLSAELAPAASKAAMTPGKKDVKPGMAQDKQTLSEPVSKKAVAKPPVSVSTAVVKPAAAAASASAASSAAGVPPAVAAMLSKLSALPPKSRDARVLAQQVREAAAAAGPAAVAAVAGQIKTILGGGASKRPAPTPAPVPVAKPAAPPKPLPPLKAEYIPSIDDIRERKTSTKVDARSNIVETIDVDIGLQQAFASEQARAAAKAAQKAAKKAANRAARLQEQQASAAGASDLFSVRASK